MRYSVLLNSCAWLCAGAAIVLAQEPDRLIDAVNGLPVEYRADVLFRLIDTGRMAGKRQVLEDLFAASSAAEYATALQDAGGRTDTRSWAIASGLRLQLDSLSIRCRVAQKMLDTDPDRARELFLTIMLPPAEPPRCEDALLPDTHIFFETAGFIADRSFPPSAGGQGDAIQFLEPVLRALSSPLEATAAAGTVRLALVRPTSSLEQRQKLLGIFTARLAEMAGGDRAFTYAVNKLGLEEELIRLGEECAAQRIGFDSTLAAYRTFLINHLQGERCGDSPAPAAILKRFNERLRLGGYLAQNDLEPLKPANLQPASVDGKLKLDGYWQSPAAKRLLSAIKHLRFGNGSAPLATQQKATPQWQAEFRRFLSDLEDWTGPDEPSPGDYFHERAILYASALEVLPPGETRLAVLRDYAGFLTQSGVEARSPIQFLPHLRELFDLVRQGEDSSTLLAVLVGSDDPVISLYAALEGQAPSNRRTNNNWPR